MKRLLYSWGVVTVLLVGGGCTSSDPPESTATRAPVVTEPRAPGPAVTEPVVAGPPAASGGPGSGVDTAGEPAAASDPPPTGDPEAANAAVSPSASESDTPAAASAESILEAPIGALGEAAAIAQVKTIRRTGTLHVEGGFGVFDGTTERAVVVGEKAFSSMNLGDAYVQTLGWNGETAWSSDTQAGVQDAQPYQLAQLRMEAAVSPLIALRDGQLGALKFLGQQEFAGATCEAIQTAGEAGATFYIDQQSKRLAGVTLVVNNPQFGGDVTLVQTYSDFQEHGGVLFPHKVTMEIGEGQMKLVYQYTDPELNAELDAQRFERP